MIRVGRFSGRYSFRKREIGRNLQTVRRFVSDGLHLRQLSARQFLPDFELRREGAGLAVEEQGLAGLGVADCRDQPSLLVSSARNDPDLVVRETAFDPVDVVAECFVFVVGLDAVGGVPGFHQFIGRFGEQSSAQVDFSQGVRFHHFGFAGLGIEQHQRDQVRTRVGFYVDALVSGLKVQGRTSLKHRAGIDPGESLRIDAEHLCVTVFRAARG